jgi:hypothetical protein
MGTDRNAKVTENELLLENVVKRVGQLGHPDATVDVMCECRQRDCRTLLAVPFREYSRTRAAQPRRFMVAPGHETTGSDAVVEQRDGYAIVEER